jgi:hypothetical protein
MASSQQIIYVIGVGHTSCDNDPKYSRFVHLVVLIREKSTRRDVRRPDALGSLWHPTHNLCCTLPGTKVQSYCLSTYKAYVGLRTKKTEKTTSVFFPHGGTGQL